jgi:hypothetical protein
MGLEVGIRVLVCILISLLCTPLLIKVVEWVAIEENIGRKKRYEKRRKKGRGKKHKGKTIRKK